MIEHWCGKSFRGSLVALSAAGFVACSPHSYDLGHEGTGAEAGSTEDGSGGSTSGKGGKGGSGGTGGTKGGTTGSGGSVTVGGGGSGNVGQGTGGTTVPGGGSAGTTQVGGLPPHALRFEPTQLDLLFMVDNSIGMAEKQQQLSQAIPALMAQLTTPPCLDANGTPTGENAPNCAPGSAPEIAPVTDIHVGVITSSLGDHGSGDVCSRAQDAANRALGSPRSNYDDRAQLLPTVRDGLGAGEFLTWDPASAADPSANAALTSDLVTQILTASQQGCGYEAQLESWYRFLVDPEPVATMTRDYNFVGVRGPVNEVLLAQRAAFLRPGSVLAIVMLTDENDCSIVDEDGTQGWLTGYKGGVDAANWHMPRASAVCAENPNDPCCRPCISSPAPGCPSNDQDASCSQTSSLPLNEDSMNLRCFRQKQRFGVDLLYPTSRYVEALTSLTIRPRLGGPEVPNPLYFAADGTPQRDGARVLLAGLVGVPWQDIATEASLTGRGLTFMTAQELVSSDRWHVLLGADSTATDPLDPLMIESIDPRPTGAPHPIVPEAAVAGPDESDNVNPINGHEQSVPSYRDDLQFACIYPLAKPVACNDENPDTCDCNHDEFAKNSPLCAGVTAERDGTQVYGKAYPGVRELQVLRDIGPSAVIASSCPKNVEATGDDDQDVGYVPALRALAARLRESLGYGCGPDKFRDSECVVVEARPTDACDCDPSTGRTAPTGLAEELAGDATDELRDVGLDPNGYCFCQVAPLGGEALDACLNTADGGDGAGYCFIDPENGHGDASLVAHCPQGGKYRLRFVGTDLPAAGAITFTECAQGL
jgi:hypothetical protein